MKKTKIIIPVILGFIIVITFVYITFENYKKEPISSRLTQTVDLVVLGEPIVNDLIGVKWNWEKTLVSKDKTIFPRTPDTFILIFAEDGKLNGSTDCNGFSSQYEKNENKLSFGLLTTTELHCKNSKEEAFKKWLAETREFSFDESGRLVLESSSSSIIFVNKESGQNEKNWNLIKQSVANCDIKSGGQTHARKVEVTLKNGDKLEAYSPKIDNIFDIVNNAEEKCGKVMLWTE